MCYLILLKKHVALRRGLQTVNSRVEYGEKCKHEKAPLKLHPILSMTLMISTELYNVLCMRQNLFMDRKRQMGLV